MASDYSKIKTENEKRYGTDIGRIGPMLLADRYDNRTHFIYELLQNAEDALGRRDKWEASREISFELSKTELRISHFGMPFTETDIRGICGIAQTTKDLTSIGRFGIGFKSVYAFTDCPEIYSGNENLAIESFVWPKEIPSINIKPQETVFLLPLRPGDVTAFEEIGTGLRELGPRTLLFLRHIEEITWSISAGIKGLFLRGKPELFGSKSRKIVVLGQDHAKNIDIEETWLIFSREIQTPDGKQAGYVEIAFQLDKQPESSIKIKGIEDSRLVVFFPTIVPTNLGFLVQGPYRTTPSRDNVPKNDPWNQYLIRETAVLLTEALSELRERDLLNVNALQSLPLDRLKFAGENMFLPLFEAVSNAFRSRELLPTFGGGYAFARNARLARTKELRELFSPNQLSSLLEIGRDIFWLNEDITQDRTPLLRQYLMQELNIVEITPEMILPKLTEKFLESQTDSWVVRLYEFLNGQPALIKQNRLNDIPLIRLENGKHVTTHMNGHLQVFLPGPVSTDFPTVKNAVCSTDGAKALLLTLGLTEPDPVDDVIRNVLPAYNKQVEIQPNYVKDLQRILNAFRTDSKSRREKLITALRSAYLIPVLDAGSGKTNFAQPGKVYLATQKFKDLFQGVSGVLLADDRYECIHGEEVRELFESCGATRYLETVAVQCALDFKQKAELRKRAGCENCTYDLEITDYTIRGLKDLLNSLVSIEPDEKVPKKVELLWDALCDLQDRKGAKTFLGTYKWHYITQRNCEFDADFIRYLNDNAWVPDQHGNFQAPSSILFENTGWKENSFLVSKIRFKPPIIEELAREAGIDPGVIELLKKLGLTNTEDLKNRLGLHVQVQGSDNTADSSVKKVGDDKPLHSPVHKPVGTSPNFENNTPGNVGGNKAIGSTSSDNGQSPGSQGVRNFISYIAVDSEEETDPDGLSKQQRMALEEAAISLILSVEPKLQRTPPNNPGFDLFIPGPYKQPMKWIEVKAITGTLYNRPVGLSHTQFKFALKCGEDYWLYIVENAGTPKAKILRIQDPAGKAKTFTFDRGWLNVSDAESGTVK